MWEKSESATCTINSDLTAANSARSAGPFSTIACKLSGVKLLQEAVVVPEEALHVQFREPQQRKHRIVVRQVNGMLQQRLYALGGFPVQPRLSGNRCEIRGNYVAFEKSSGKRAFRRQLGEREEESKGITAGAPPRLIV